MPAGRPTKINEITLQKLEDAFLMGATNLQASIYADISESLLYEYKAEHPEFVEKIDKLKGMTSLRAKLNLINSIKNGEINDSKWWLERKDKDFKTTLKQEVSLEGDTFKAFLEAISDSKAVKNKADDE